MIQNNITTEIVNTIVSEMKKQKITVSKIETDLNLGSNTISMWKRGTNPTLEKLIKVIKYLNISLDDRIKINKIDNNSLSNVEISILNLFNDLSYEKKNSLFMILKLIVNDFKE